MAGDAAELRGRVMVRPFRVAQLVDTSDAQAVRAAFASLTRTWGGIFTPVLDASTPHDELGRQALNFDVDAMFTEDQEGGLAKWLRSSGWGWTGRGEWGPFAHHYPYGRSLLPAKLVDVARNELLVPTWSSAEVLDLFYTAQFGAVGPLPVTERAKAPPSFEVPGSTEVGLGYLFTVPNLTADDAGAVQATRMGAEVSDRRYLDGLGGVVVARPGCPQDLVRFWNLRSYGRRIICLPNDAPVQLLDFLTRGVVAGSTLVRGDGRGHEAVFLNVWGLEHADPRVSAKIEEMAARLQMQVRPAPGEPSTFGHPGLETKFEATFRTEIRSNASVGMVRAPALPLTAETNYAPGVVAVEINLYDAHRLDPRSAAQLPPFRRHGRLLEEVIRVAGVNQVRITAEGDGIVVGQQASRDEVPVGFATHLAGIQTLFDDDQMAVAQSDDGRFQTRASEMLGGAHGTLLLQPGVRTAISKAAASPTGLNLEQLRAAVRNYRGAWPDTVFSNLSPKDYAINVVNQLLLSGLFVPMLDVHCSYCRVESQMSAISLDATLRCEFCGEDFKLALSLALSKSRSAWRYRLASHLTPQKVTALLPALATASLFGQFHSVEGPPSLHAFGVTFAPTGRDPIEADIVTYLGRPTWVTVIGEVKTSNRIDEKDVRNLEYLQARLDKKSVRSLLLFTTLKDEFAPAEVKVLRALVERAVDTQTAHGAVVPRLPLLLTGKDLSLPWSHDEHPWRWAEDRGYLEGIFGKASESCRRNLGLLDFELEQSSRPARFEWDELLVARKRPATHHSH